MNASIRTKAGAVPTRKEMDTHGGVSFIQYVQFDVVDIASPTSGSTGNIDDAGDTYSWSPSRYVS